MKYKVLFITLVLLLITGLNRESYTWGFYGHKRINRMAVFTLPPELFTFYKYHIEFVTEHAIDPDKRRYGVDGEAERHFIDFDHYTKTKDFSVMPRKWDEAVAKFSEDTLKAYGIVPWHIEVMYKRLMWAFKDENLDRILRTSSDIGHYIADAHVPLHTTENYNGQKTNQKGIHGFWESRIPEMKAEGYNYFVGRAQYIESPLSIAWETVESSHTSLDSVLDFEKKLSASFPTDRKYSYETRGATTMQTYSQEYTEAYDKLMNGMVERRMRKAIIMVGSIWYTAWVDAGQPDLSKFNGQEVSDALKKELEEEDNSYKTGKIKGREHQD